MKQYQQYLADIIARGKVKSDRTGTGTVSAFGHFLRFNLKEGFPLVTVKRTHFKSIKAELLWFLEGSTDNERLHELGCTIWDEWATEDGQLGPVYGAQWRSWPVPYASEPRGLWERLIDAIKGRPAPMATYDQVFHAQYSLRENPTSRRILISGWNPAVLPDEYLSPQDNVRMGKQALPPCHMSFIFNATPLTVDERIELALEAGTLKNADSAKSGLRFFLLGKEEDEVDPASHEWLDEYTPIRYSLNGLLTMRSQLSAA